MTDWNTRNRQLRDYHINAIRSDYRTKYRLLYLAIGLCVLALMLSMVACQPVSKVGLIPPLVRDIDCTEDMPCWNPATMGDGIGLVCYTWPNGELHAYHDNTGAIGTPADCPKGMIISG